jgi:signal transduction histidine kinase
VIATRILKALPFSWFVLDQDGALIESGDGAMFPAAGINSSSALKTATGVTVGGWGVCPQGFAVYRFATPAIEPFSIAIYGLKVTGISTAQGKSEALSIKLEPSQVTSFVANFCAGIEAMDDGYRALIRENIHEIRGINSALYNAAYELQQMLDGVATVAAAAPISKSVVSLSELLTARMDFMDFIANPNAENVHETTVAVYRKFDRLQRCFRVTAQRRGIQLTMQGSSTASVYGPPVFDLVPYLLLDNAVKYSPDRMPITVACHDTSNQIICSVASIGPQILPEEIAKIFASSMRGENAIRTRKTGSGLGLSVLERIVKLFNGRVSVRQSDIKVWINNIAYTEVVFEIHLPIYKTRF